MGLKNVIEMDSWVDDLIFKTSFNQSHCFVLRQQVAIQVLDAHISKELHAHQRPDKDEQDQDCAKAANRFDAMQRLRDDLSHTFIEARELQHAKSSQSSQRVQE